MMLEKDPDRRPDIREVKLNSRFLNNNWCENKNSSFNQ